jgi:hypothetical protein
MRAFVSATMSLLLCRDTRWRREGLLFLLVAADVLAMLAVDADEENEDERDKEAPCSWSCSNCCCVTSAEAARRRED